MNWTPKIDILFSIQLFIAAVVLFFISLYAQNTMFVLITFLLLLVIWIPYIYFKKICQNIHLSNPGQKIRLFNGEEDTLKLTLENKGKLPVFNGMFQFGLKNNIWCDDLKNEGGTKTINQFSFRYNLFRNEKAEFPIKVRGVRRGAARVSTVQMTIRGLLGVGTLGLKYDPFFRTEVIVFPELKAVGGLDQIKKFEQGDQPMQFSLFEELTAPMGTRDYAWGDPFNRIHWKASARSTELQTKQYEKTTGMTWTLILHLGRNREDVSNSSDDLERNISCMAYLCKYATTRKIPYDIFVNIKVRGKDFIMHLHTGEGREQLSKALEMMARINFNSITVSQEAMLAFVDRVMYRAPLVILFNCGRKENEQRYFSKWERKGATLFEIKHKDEAAYIVTASKRRKVIS